MFKLLFLTSPTALIFGTNKISLRLYSQKVLRDYQIACIDKCMESINHGIRRIGVSIATGGGKTVIFSHLINELTKSSYKEQGYRSLILVHRRELANQAANTIKKFFPYTNVQIEMGKMTVKLPEAEVIIASVQTLIRRLDKYPPNFIDLIIIDEAHHAIADSYIKILNHFGADVKDTLIPVIGFSATFERSDKKALSRVMDKIVFERDILKMINEKWLCEGKFTTIDVNVNLNDVPISNKDFQITSLSSVMNTPHINRIILSTYLYKKTKHKIKSTMLFGVDINHVTTLYGLFQSNGINAQYVTSKTKKAERDLIVENFKNGKIEILMNCGIFTEGTNIPNIDCILLCRPTKSRTMLIQMIGRGLRLYNSKKYCHIIDFVSACNVGVVSIPSLIGITKLNDSLTDATLQDLLDIKTQIEKQHTQKKYDSKQKQEYRDQNIKDFLNSTNALDLTLMTFNNFKSFAKFIDEKSQNIPYEKMSDDMKEITLFKSSIYPWVKFSNTAWAMELSQGNHIRIYRKNVKEQNIYTLKLYRSAPHWYYSETSIKYIPKTIKETDDLLIIMANVDTIINTLKNNHDHSYINISNFKSVKNFSKFSPWRNYAASDKQKKVLETLIIKHYDEDNSFKRKKGLESITNYINNLTRGDASNLFFAISLAPVYPIKILLRTLILKLNHNS